MRILLLIFIILFPGICRADIVTGLVGYWKLDELSGSLIDSSPSGLNGTATGTTSVSGRTKNARNFNGSTDKITITDASSIYAFANTTFTVSLWYNTSSGGFAIGKKGGFSGWIVNASTSPQFNTKNASSNSAIRTASTPVTASTWHMATGVITTSTTVTGNNSITIYIDGQLNQGTLTQTAVYTSPTSSDLVIGQRVDGAASASPYTGLIDEIRIYNRGLTAADISQLYENSFNLFNNSVINNAVFN